MARPKRTRKASTTEVNSAASTSGNASTENVVPGQQLNDVGEPARKKRKYGKAAAKADAFPPQDSSAFGTLCADMLIEVRSRISPAIY